MDSSDVVGFFDGKWVSVAGDAVGSAGEAIAVGAEKLGTSSTIEGA
jgi:hypothetical protein